eukprot:15452118-Alexandrium_andersonii.AAC.1
MRGPFGRAPHKAASVGRASPHVQCAVAFRTVDKRQCRRGGEGRLPGSSARSQTRTGPGTPCERRRRE